MKEKQDFKTHLSPYGDELIELNDDSIKKLLGSLLRDEEQFIVKTDYHLDLLGWIIRIEKNGKFISDVPFIYFG